MEAISIEPGQVFGSWEEFKSTLDKFSEKNKVIFNIGHAKKVVHANKGLRKPPYFAENLKYQTVTLRCKHYGKYVSQSAGQRPKQK